MMNVAEGLTPEKDKSAYERRHGVRPVHVPWVPFGTLIRFKPNGPDQAAMLRYEQRSVPGLFLGFHLQPGGLFSGDYKLAALRSFRESHNDKVKVYRVKEIILPSDGDEWVFPLKRVADAAELWLPPKEVLQKVLEDLPEEEDYSKVTDIADEPIPEDPFNAVADDAPADDAPVHPRCR